MLGNSSHFLLSEHPCELKNLDVALVIAGVKKQTDKQTTTITKNTLGQLAVTVNIDMLKRPFDSSLE